MFRLVFLVYFLFSATMSVQAQEFEREFAKPSIDQMVEWIPEQVPRTVSIYFDTDGDGMIDLIVAYHLIEAYACKENCTIEVAEFDDHWILVSSIGSNPYSYYIIKKWSLWKNMDYEEWKGVQKTFFIQ